MSYPKYQPGKRPPYLMFACAALGFVLATAGSASAESEPADAAAALRDAETAYQSVDFSAVYASSQLGLTLGSASPAETARLHVLAGTSAALIGKDDESRGHFIVALAIQPTLKLEQDLSPKVRDPYLEALGFWGSKVPRLALTVKCDERSNRMSIQLTDQAQLGRNVRALIRIHGHDNFTVQELEPHPRERVSLTAEATQRGFDYYVVLLDEHQNRLVEVGSEDEPITVDGQQTVSQSASQVSTTPSTVPPTQRARTAWLSVTLMTAGLAVGGVGVYFNVRRENAASRWNGITCEQPGQTRIQQCNNINSERANMERLAVGSYVLGGALLATGVALVWFGARSDTKHDDAHSQAVCAANPLALSIGCSGYF